MGVGGEVGGVMGRWMKSGSSEGDGSLLRGEVERAV